MALKVIKNTLLLQASIEYNGPHKQISFEHCWSPHLNNPLLNKLYKDSIPYTERWFLETRRLINDEMWDHPLLNSILLDPVLKYDLIKSTIIDGAIMRSAITNLEMPEYQMSASVNLKKLIRWCAFFASLPDSHETLVALNGQSRD
jgi:hypothetical protein